MRLDNWPKLLADAIAAAKQKPFIWGGHFGGQDCCTFAADCALAITGCDPLLEIRGSYATEAEAYDLINSHGGLLAFVQEVATDSGWRRMPILQARRGDIVYHTQAPGSAPGLAVCAGPHAFAPRLGATGLTSFPTLEAIHAWRVE